MTISADIHLVFRALFSKNNAELGKKSILGQPPRPGRTEFINLHVRDVDLKRKVLTLHTKKRTGKIKSRQIRMVEPLVEILVPLCALGNEYVFLNPETGKKYFDMNTVLPRLCKKAKIEPFTFHAIRHYGASYLASVGRSTKEIQQILGHSELRTTEIYLQDLKDVAEVAEEL